MARTTESLRSGARPRISLRGNFAWALGGNVVYAASQWANLMLLTKLTSARTVGDYALASAICLPVVALFNLQLRALQVTDARSEYEFGHYMALRLVTSATAQCSIGALAILAGMDQQIVAVTMIVGAGYNVAAIREVLQSYMQRCERMDMVSVSLGLTGVLGVAAVGASLHWSGSLIVAMTSLLMVRLGLGWVDAVKVGRLSAAREGPAGGLAFVMPEWDWRRLAGLAWLAAPMGAAMILISYTGNVPRYFIERYQGREALGYFAAIASLPMAGGIAVKAAAYSTSARLAEYYEDDIQAFGRLLAKLVAFGIAMGLGGLGVAVVAGPPILSAAFTPAYAQFGDLLVWLMAWGAVNFLTTFIGNGVTATRCFKPQLLVMAGSLASTTLLAYALIPTNGVVGAAVSLLAGAAVEVGGLSILLARRLAGRGAGGGPSNG